MGMQTKRKPEMTSIDYILMFKSMFIKISPQYNAILGHNEGSGDPMRLKGIRAFSMAF